MSISLKEVEVGDIVTRMLAGAVPMELNVTAVTPDIIVCGPWTFDRTTGGEIDEELGYDGKTRTGSQLVKVTKPART